MGTSLSVPFPARVRRFAGRVLTLFGASAIVACNDSTSPAVLSHIAVVSGDAQSASVGKALTAPFVVRVSDQSYIQMAGVNVTWMITSGGGSLSATTSVTDENGQARTTYTPGTAGAGSVVATVDGLTPVTFSVTITAANDTNQ